MGVDADVPLHEAGHDLQLSLQGGVLRRQPLSVAVLIQDRLAGADDLRLAPDDLVLQLIAMP